MTAAVEEGWGSKEADLRFISLFFDELKRRAPEDQAEYVRSLRRTKSLANYLTSLYMRSGCRAPEDFIVACRSTLIPELQDLGQQIAREILYGKKRPPPEESGGEKEMEYAVMRQLLRAGPQTDYVLSQLNQYSQGMEDEELHNLKKMLFRVWAGAGRDRQLRWIEHEDNLTDLRVPLEKIIKIGRAYYRKFSETRDGFSEHVLRPFEIGDDPDSIDYDETIENIHDQGKRAEQIRYDDIIVKDSKRKRWCVVYLHDISWSMEGFISITNEMLATLVQAFRDDDYGIGLFRDDFYVMKALDEHREIDRVSANILTLRPFGGTVLVRGLDWAEDQFKKAGKNTEKVCVILGDFMFYWPALTYNKVRRLIKDGVRTVGISTGTGAQSWSENTGAPVINVVSMLQSARDMEDLLVRSLDEIYRAIFLRHS